MPKRSLKFNKVTEKQQTNKKLKSALFYTAGVGRDGCGAFRMEWPRSILNTHGVAEIQNTSFIQPFEVNSPKGKVINPIYAGVDAGVDAVVMQRPTDVGRLNSTRVFSAMQKSMAARGAKPFRTIIDVDDILHGDYVSKYNSNGSHYFNNERFKVFAEAVKNSDELHVCSKAMAEFYKEHIEGYTNVLHKPNFLPKYLYDWYDEDRTQKNYEKHQDKPRILYAGATQHFDVLKQNGGKDDFTHILELIERTKHNWQWVFFGGHPTQLEADVKSGLIEYHRYVPITSYPKKLIELEPTVIITPLENNTFNACKSNIKLTEAGALGIAGVYQDLDPYAEAPLKFETADEMADHIKFLLNDWDDYVKVIRQQREFSEKFFAEDNLDMMLASYFTDFNSVARNKICPRLKDIQ